MFINPSKQHDLIDPTEWSDLCWRHANEMYRGHNAARSLDRDDFYQAASIGMLIASRKYNEVLAGDGKFASFAYWYIKREINNLMYKQNGENKLIPRFIEPHYDDIASSNGNEVHEEDVDLTIENDEAIATECFNEDERYFDEFMKGADMNLDETQYFMDMVQSSDIDASKSYIERTGKTRQRANQIKNSTRKKARKIYAKREVTRNV